MSIGKAFQSVLAALKAFEKAMAEARKHPGPATEEAARQAHENLKKARQAVGKTVK